jgi:hypothetical protein
MKIKKFGIGSKKKALALMAVMWFFINMAWAGEKNADIKFGGLVQTWFSYSQGEADDPYGFGVKRLEFSPHGSITERIDWGFMVGWDNNEFRLFDAFLDLKIHDTFKLKVGRFSVPGAISGSLSPSGALDLIERAAITMHWAGNSAIFGERSWGIQGYGDLLEDKLYYALMVANRGNLDDNFTPSIKAAAHDFPGRGLYLWSRLEAKPIEGLRIGAFYGTGEDKEPGLERVSYGAHLFYVKKCINFKAEYIAGENSGGGTGELKYSGAYLVLGYRIGKVEGVARYDFTTPNDNGADEFSVREYKNVSLGVNYNYNKRIRFQVNYVFKAEEMAAGLSELDNNIFYINIQYGY